jgi:hypothetical protein
MQAEALRAVLVGGPGEQAPVRTDGQGAQGEIGRFPGQQILVEEDLHGTLGADWVALPHAVLLAGAEPPAIREPPLADRHRGVVRRNARLQLLVERRDQRAVRLHRALEPRVLGAQMIQDLGFAHVGPARIAQPGVAVGPAHAEPLVRDRLATGARRARDGVGRCAHAEAPCTEMPGPRAPGKTTAWGGRSAGPYRGALDIPGEGLPWRGVGGGAA